MSSLRLSALFALILVQISISRVYAEDAVQSARAKQLLANAVSYYRDQGDAALAAFSRQGEFIDGDHYVFVVDTKGTMLASGGSSAVLIGRDVSSVLQPELKSAFREVLSAPEDGVVKSVEYRWLNARDGKVERKKVYYQRYKDRIFAVGVYLPRATAEQASALLAKSAHALKENPAAAIQAINSLSPEFREDDLYVFVVDLRTQRYEAHGYNLRLIGVNFSSIYDSQGKPVGKPIMALLKKSDFVEYDYKWKNPVTSKIEDKHALIRKVGIYLVAVGYYSVSSPPLD
ncbi:cache domain-containing protein [Pseudomonas sp. Irchel s3f7]|uniref:cache domain-containing protein n=1 Tax=Pseudomonas sp. Irchel s3f7 TaxID=2009153 RepID=UPI000BA33D72|nr:cache domain-containing protein [Pseudomonas sp. Irchel s3f7]